MRENPHQFDNVSTIVSDANVPGEGEHKIMEFTRHQLEMGSHEYNTRHMLYGGVYPSTASHISFLSFLRLYSAFVCSFVVKC
jgi:hypothetical protein